LFLILGAIYFKANSLIWLNECLFEGNEARVGKGGGVYVESVGTVNISSCIFDGCKGTSGGGIYIKGINYLIILNYKYIMNLNRFKKC
jgi:predicted outer membrane repeat protein